MSVKKELFLPVLCGSIIIGISACGNSGDKPNNELTTEASAAQAVETSSSDSEIQGALEAISDVNVEKGLFNVELDIPAEFMGEKTQEELDESSKEKGYKSITLHDDGSATYVMTKQQHKQMMEELNTSIESALEDMIGSEDYPNLINIKTNDNYTEFEITTKSTDLSLAESFSTLAFYMYGGTYNIFNGTSVDNVSVKFINADSGDIISTSNSKDMGE